jgi:hypothetical protein
MGQPPPDPALTLHSVDESDFHVEASQALPPVISLSKDMLLPKRDRTLLPILPNAAPIIVTWFMLVVGPFVMSAIHESIGEL